MDNATHRLGDRLAEARLAHTGRPDERKDGARASAPRVGRSSVGSLALQLAHGQEFDDAFLDLVEAGVVSIELFLGRSEVEGVGRAFAREVEASRATGGSAALHRLVAHALETVEFLVDCGDGRGGIGPGSSSVPASSASFARTRRSRRRILRRVRRGSLHLATKDCFALILLEAVAHGRVDVVVDLGLGELDQADRGTRFVRQVDRLEELVTAILVEVWPQAGVGGVPGSSMSSSIRPCAHRRRASTGVGDLFVFSRTGSGSAWARKRRAGDRDVEHTIGARLALADAHAEAPGRRLVPRWAVGPSARCGRRGRSWSRSGCRSVQFGDGDELGVGRLEGLLGAGAFGGHGDHLQEDDTVGQGKNRGVTLLTVDTGTSVLVSRNLDYGITTHEVRFAFPQPVTGVVTWSSRC